MDNLDGTSRLPSVAVLLSTYNGAPYLQEQLESLRAQKDVVVSLHVRDDGSSDGTCSVLHRYAKVWPDLLTVSSGPNLGAADSFLHLLRTAPDDVDYYAFCDQDDVWLPNKLARAVSALTDTRGPALYCSNVICTGEDLKVFGAPSPHRDHRFQHVLFENIATGCTVVLNSPARALINSCQPARGVVMHDWWCALVVSALGHVHYDPEPSVLYRQHVANSIGLDISWTAHYAKQIFRFIQKARSFYPIHAQAAELLRLFGCQMPPHHRADLVSLVASKRSRRARIAYAMSGQIVRRRLLDAVLVRGLMLTGWY